MLERKRELQEPKDSDSKIEFKEEKPASKECFCDRIYKAAKNPNKKEAKATIEEILLSACIDVTSPTKNYTAVIKLASEGESKAVNFLRNEFNVSLLYMVLGYAQGGYIKEANKILALAQNPTERFLFLEYMALGYARGGYVEEANKLLELVAPDEQFKLFQKMAYGYTQGGYVEEANALVALAKTPAERLSLWGEMAMGYARSGNVTEANKVLALAEIPADRLALLSMLACGYTRSGNVTEVNKVLALAETLADQLVLLKSMLDGYALGGHRTEVRKVFNLLQKTLKSYYAQGGNVEEANKVLALEENTLNFEQLKELRLSVTVCYARGGHKEEAYKILKECKKRRRVNDFLFILRAITEGFVRGDHVKEVNEILQDAMEETTSVRERRILVNEVIHGYTEQGKLREANKALAFLKKAEEKDELLKKIGAYFNEVDKMAFSNKCTTLQTLAAFHPDFHLTILQEGGVKEFKDLKESKEVNIYLKEARKLNEVMTKFNFTFNQARGWIQQEMLVMLLQGPQLVKKGQLAPDVFLLILTYLIGNGVHFHEISKLQRTVKRQSDYVKEATIFGKKPPLTLFDASQVILEVENLHAVGRKGV